jgi:hypothetical protein
MDLDELLNQLTEDQLSAIEKRTDLGPLSFGPAVAHVRLIRGWADAASKLDSAVLFPALKNETPQHLGRVISFVQQMREFDIASTPNPSELHRNIGAEVEGEKDWFAQTVSPYLRLEEVDVSALHAEAAEAVRSTRALEAEAQGLLEKLRVASGSAGAAKVSTFYRDQAETHRTQATRFLAFGAVSLVLTAVASIGLFVAYPPQAVDSSDWLLFTREALARLLIIGIPAYVAAFALRNYRVNKHLQVVNEQKRTALDTYPLFTESVSDEATRGLIAVELLRATVGLAETGYFTGHPDKTILESAPVVQLPPARPPA